MSRGQLSIKHYITIATFYLVVFMLSPQKTNIPKCPRPSKHDCRPTIKYAQTSFLEQHQGTECDPSCLILTSTEQQLHNASLGNSLDRNCLAVTRLPARFSPPLWFSIDLFNLLEGHSDSGSLSQKLYNSMAFIHSRLPTFFFFIFFSKVNETLLETKKSLHQYQ